MIPADLARSDGISISVDERSKLFTAKAGTAHATLEFRRRANRFIITHTVVLPGSEGRGLAGELVRAAVAYAAQRNLTVVPLCPFARAWLRRHPDVAATATVEWPASVARQRDTSPVTGPDTPRSLPRTPRL